MQASEAISSTSTSTSMRYISENIHFSMMMNSIFPQSSSQLYGFGFSSTADQAAVSDNYPALIDSKFSFYMDTKPNFQNGLSTAGAGVHSQSPLVNQYHSGPSSEVLRIKRLECPATSFGSIDHVNYRATTPAYNSKQQQQQQQRSYVERVALQPNLLGTIGHGTTTRKRRIENIVDNDTTTKRSSPEFVGGNRQSRLTTTKKTAMSVQQKMQRLDQYNVQKESKDVQRDTVVPRRSQKIADKITALQKLVSPYGKTDTASVLHEASIFIKVLQDQIESSFHSLRSTSMEKEYPESKIMADTEFDLRGQGFCLVPVSLTRNLIKEDSVNHYFSTTNIDLYPQNPSTHF